MRIAAAIPAGQGPDVVQLFYGWLQDYLKAGLLQPLPADAFSVVEIEKEFFPIVQQMKLDGKYYALPTAVRSLALFWNKTLFKEAGLDPDQIRLDAEREARKGLAEIERLAERLVAEGRVEFAVAA